MAVWSFFFSLFWWPFYVNFLNLMPYGPDRTNLYLFAYFPIPVLLAIDSLYALGQPDFENPPYHRHSGFLFCPSVSL